jgi:arsenical pump membrane protein
LVQDWRVGDENGGDTGGFTRVIVGMDAAICTVAGVATAGVIVRPWGLPEAIWAVLGAAILVAAGLLPWDAALVAAGKGMDVYLFLIGMMLLSEIARGEGLFDWLAARAVGLANGSAMRLYFLVYGVGVVVTAFLSNDATAVVLTPAVFAAARAARAEPLPYLFACAFIANAASFVLPISNPANLVLYAGHLPNLGEWLGRFLLPSILAILACCAASFLVARSHLRVAVRSEIEQPVLSGGGWAAAIGIAATTGVLLTASAMGMDLGLPTCIAGITTAAIVLLRKREAPWDMLRGISWPVLPLVAGLFVLVEGMDRAGLVGWLTAGLHGMAQHAEGMTAWVAGIGLAVVTNMTNNLPAGLVAAQVAAAGEMPRHVTDALLIGVDLGPNLSVTGSLATILWLTALRREGVTVSFARFLVTGAVVMPPALLLALAGLMLR